MGGGARYNMISPSGPHARRATSASAQMRAARPAVDLLETGVKPVTPESYEQALRGFQALVLNITGLTLKDPSAAGSPQAISILGVLYLQAGFDSQQHGVGDAQNFIAGLKRALTQASLQIQGAHLHVETKQCWDRYAQLCRSGKRWSLMSSDFLLD